MKLSKQIKFCFHVIASMLKNDPQPKQTTGHPKKCLFIDSGKNFCCKRLGHILEMNQNKSDDPSSPQNLKQPLENIQVVRCRNVFQLLDILFAMENGKSSHSSYSETSSDLKFTCPHLLIIDSLSSILEHFKLLSLVEAQYHQSLVLSRLKYLAAYLHMAVIVTTTNGGETAPGSYAAVFDDHLRSAVNLCVSLRCARVVDKCEAQDEEQIRGAKSDSLPPSSLKIIEVLKCNRAALSDADQTVGFFEITDSGICR